MRKHRSMPYVMTPFIEEVAKDHRPEALAFFLLENVGSVCGSWAGHMSTVDQRKLFGLKIGKGLIVINGATETVDHNISVSFGTMRASVWDRTWRELEGNYHA